jgi:hypothetical protein
MAREQIRTGAIKDLTSFRTLAEQYNKAYNPKLIERNYDELGMRDLFYLIIRKQHGIKFSRALATAHGAQEWLNKRQRTDLYDIKPEVLAKYRGWEMITGDLDRNPSTLDDTVIVNAQKQPEIVNGYWLDNGNKLHLNREMDTMFPDKIARQEYKLNSDSLAYSLMLRWKGMSPKGKGKYNFDFHKYIHDYLLYNPNAGAFSAWQYMNHNVGAIIKEQRYKETLITAHQYHADYFRDARIQTIKYFADELKDRLAHAEDNSIEFTPAVPANVRVASVFWAIYKNLYNKWQATYRRREGPRMATYIGNDADLQAAYNNFDALKKGRARNDNARKWGTAITQAYNLPERYRYVRPVMEDFDLPTGSGSNPIITNNDQ